MKKTVLIIALVLVLAATSAYAGLVKPMIVPVDPLPGGKLSGNYILKVSMQYPDQPGDRIDAKQVMFRYIKTNCTQNCKILIGNDLSDAFGWSVVWDTTTVPNGTYDIQVYAFAEGGNLLLAQTLISGVIVDQSFEKPPQTVELETNVTEEKNVTVEVPVQKNLTPKQAPKNTTQPAKAPAKSGFWAKFFDWLKSLFS